MERREEIALRRLQRLVNDETDQARARFRRDFAQEPPYIALSVLTESVGKVNRCFNKLGMAADDDAWLGWMRELKTEMVKTNSILDRIYLAYVEDTNANEN